MDVVLGGLEIRLPGRSDYTGDLGMTDEGRYPTITGRADDMIISGGGLVSSIKVEEALEDHESYRQPSSLGRPTMSEEGP